MEQVNDLSPTVARRIGALAIASAVAYFVSDAIEAAQGEFSDGQLLLTLVAEAAIPFVVVGLFLARRSLLGRLGLVSAAGYAYAYVFFTGTVVYALVDGTPDYDALTDDLGLAMTVHGLVMVLAGIGFGLAAVRSGAFPRWTGWALALGVVLVAATQGAPEGAQLGAAAVRAAAFAGMGLSLLGAAPSPAPA
jgi:hypothetical protein